MDDTIAASVNWDSDAWLVRVDTEQGLVAQARRLADAPDVARRLWTGQHPEVAAEAMDAVAVELEITLPPGMSDTLKHADDLRAEAAAKQAQASILVRQVASQLCASGLTKTDIGAVLGVSQQRVSQLLAEYDDSVEDAVE